MKLSFSGRTRLFYEEMLKWIDKGCPKTIVLDAHKTIFANAVSWDGYDMAAAKEVLGHLLKLEDSPDMPMNMEDMADNAIKNELLLDSGNYYKNPKVVNFIKNRAFNGLSLK